MSESARALSRWTEAIGIIGVIASLIFVGIEIRQNTQAVRGATYQSLTESSMELLFRLAEDPAASVAIDAWGRGEQLDPLEQAKVEALVLSDYAAVQGFVLAMAFLFVLLNLIIDLAYSVIDPRFGSAAQ